MSPSRCPWSRVPLRDQLESRQSTGGFPGLQSNSCPQCQVLAGELRSVPPLRDVAVPRGAGQGAWSPLCPRLQRDPCAQPWHLRPPCAEGGNSVEPLPAGRMRPAPRGQARTLPALTQLLMNKSRGIQQPLAAVSHWKQPRGLVGLSAPLALCGVIPSSGRNAATPASPSPDEEDKAAPTSSQPPDRRMDTSCCTAVTQAPQPWGFPCRRGDPCFRIPLTCLGGAKAWQRLLTQLRMPTLARTVLGKGKPPHADLSWSELGCPGLGGQPRALPPHPGSAAAIS